MREVLPFLSSLSLLPFHSLEEAEKFPDSDCEILRGRGTRGQDEAAETPRGPGSASSRRPGSSCSSQIHFPRRCRSDSDECTCHLQLWFIGLYIHLRLFSLLAACEECGDEQDDEDGAEDEDQGDVGGRGGAVEILVMAAGHQVVV